MTSTTSLPGFNGSYNDTKKSFKVDITEEILQYIYDKLHIETNYLLIILYVPVIALAVTANVLVIAVVFKYHYMRSVTNYFVVNLSVADLLVTTICMPVAVSQAISIVWTHGELMCKLSSYLQGVAVAASIFTITAMSIDRYLAIRNPIALRRVFNRKSTVLVIVALWLVALIIFAPILRAMTLHNPVMDLSNITLNGSWTMTRNISQNTSRVPRVPPAFSICSEDFRPLGIKAPLFSGVCFVLVYAIPEGKATPDALSYCLFLGHANSALNPMVYCFMTRNFRRSVAEILRHGLQGLTRSRPRRRSVQGTGVVDDVCAGCSTGGTMKRGLLRKRRMLPGCGCGLPIGGHHAVLALRRTNTTSSGYDSFYSRHSPHRRCYMLRSLSGRPQTTVEQVKNVNKTQETNYEKNETDPPRVNTLVTTDEQGGVQINDLT
ncbi:unnamed protein product [Xylocopa violacea]|uniref:G-protein coupled receptors family 1 profile domain-containing protein n=1 Tax=Xylocopa violacea TaxID=135666 RepID=A0ABP1N027_XYLVO